MINIKIKNKYIPNLRKKTSSLQSENLDTSLNKNKIQYLQFKNLSLNQSQC